MSGKTMIQILVFVVLAAVVVSARLVGHLPNFTPIIAVSLFAGFFFAQRWLAIVLIVAAMGISDLFLGFYQPAIMLVVYASLLLPIAARSILRKGLTVPRIGLTAVGCSFTFFLATNLAVWLFSGMYVLTITGLVECYVAALPFYKYQLMGDAFWTTSLFGCYALSGLERRPGEAPSSFGLALEG